MDKRQGAETVRWSVTEEPDGTFLRRNGRVVSFAEQVPLLVAEVEWLRGLVDELVGALRTWGISGAPEREAALRHFDGDVSAT